jgi:hypothetical protein
MKSKCSGRRCPRMCEQDEVAVVEGHEEEVLAAEAVTPQQLNTH